ncbi:MAG: SEC-C metal-binding domain-containing protein [Candidatus Nanoarchaeia archaeon]|nr:SEC-C metal-binding domain-containing protein [Candidatus Nanoarchaeia archaeon]
MNIETGEIISNDEYNNLDDLKKEKYIEMKVNPTRRQLKRKKVGRNELCPCGSGKKFKFCHLKKENDKI